MNKIKPADARYIKLGQAGAKEEDCFKRGVLCIGFHQFPDFGKLPREQIRAASQKYAKTLLRNGHYKNQNKATAKANQVADFYLCGDDTLWITFSRGHLWWCFARPEIKYFGADEKRFPYASRERKTVDGWRKTSIGGNSLTMERLDGRLTKTAAYQETICSIKSDAFAYLARTINDETTPEITEAKKRRAAVLESIVALMRSLHPITFELLVDLVFSQSGWRRIGATGGSQETIDIALELPSTGETAFVQVKSETNKPQFNDYIARLNKRSEARMFYVYHTGPRLSAAQQNVTVVDAERLAEMVLNAGLFDWLIRKSGF